MHNNLAGAGAALAVTAALAATGVGIALAQDARSLTVEQTSIQTVQAPAGPPTSNPLRVVAWVEGAFPISRSRAHTHRRHGHPLQTVPSAGLIERPQEKNRVDALR